MENTSDSFMPGSLLFCMKSKKSVCYSVADNICLSMSQVIMSDNPLREAEYMQCCVDWKEKQELKHHPICFGIILQMQDEKMDGN